MRLHLEIVRHLLGDGSTAQRSAERAAFGAHPDVRADSPRPLLVVRQDPAREAYQRQNQSHGNGDEQDAEQAAHRFMLEIFENEFSGHRSCFPRACCDDCGAGEGACPTICNLVPSGCINTNLSSDTPLLISAFWTSSTTAYSSRGRSISMCFGKGTLSNICQLAYRASVRMLPSGS